MYHVVICDDDQGYIDDLKGMIIDSGQEKENLCFYEYHSGLELLKNIPQQIDILFLDIQMDGLDGNETAKLLKEKSFHGVLVLFSGVYNPTPETIEIAPYRYLLKQDSRETNTKIIKAIFAEADKRNQCHVLEAFYRRENIVVPTADILFFERYRGESRVWMFPEKMENYKNGAVCIRLSLEELEKKLEPMDFATPHNSYLVNLRHINNYNPDEKSISLVNEKIYISRSRQEGFMKRMMQYMRMKYEGEI